MTELETLPVADQRFLREAAAYLENPRFLMRLANLAGKPAEGLLQLLPQSVQKRIGETTNSALSSALQYAVRTLPDKARNADSFAPITAPAMGELVKPGTPSTRLQRLAGHLLRKLDSHWHTAATATTGAVGGIFGLAGLSFELPATTVLMMRSIASIAADNGLDLNDPLVRLQCLSVFSLGSQPLDKMESAYLTSRVGLSLTLREAAAFFAKHTSAEVASAISKGTAPVLVNLINKIASRFQVVLTQKMAAQSAPVAGAAMGALINAAFTDHFNRVARFHFGIVRMERTYGRLARVQAAYEQACAEFRAASDKPFVYSAKP